MIVLVCGGRGYTDYVTVTRVLDAIDPKPEIVITGGCRSGADYHAEVWAYSRGCVVGVFRAPFEAMGRSAGPRRNAAMLTCCRVDLVVAFPGGRGTADMVKRALEAGIKVQKI